MNLQTCEAVLASSRVVTTALTMPLGTPGMLLSSALSLAEECTPDAF